MKLALLGAGAWATALAISFASHHAVAMWARRAELRETLRHSRRSPYLRDVELPASVSIADDAQAAIGEAELVLVATPTAGLRESAALVRASGRRLPLVWACKGFEASTSLMPHEVVAQVLGADAPAAALSGPSFALEVARGLPTALTLAARDSAFAEATALALHHRRLRIYFSDDVVGVEVGGAVKNVMAIATGIADGLGLGLNARAALITRGLAEITRLGLALGGRAETFMGLTGAGDLILTATGDLSRNRRVGLALGRGEPLERILAGLGHVAEGVHTSLEVERLAARRGVDMPITHAVCDVLFRGVAPADAVEQLLARDPKEERL